MKKLMIHHNWNNGLRRYKMRSSIKKDKDRKTKNIQIKMNSQIANRKIISATKDLESIFLIKLKIRSPEDLNQSMTKKLNLSNILWSSQQIKTEEYQAVHKLNIQTIALSGPNAQFAVMIKITKSSMSLSKTQIAKIILNMT